MFAHYATFYKNVSQPTLKHTVNHYSVYFEFWTWVARFDNCLTLVALKCRWCWSARARWHHCTCLFPYMLLPVLYLISTTYCDLFDVRKLVVAWHQAKANFILLLLHDIEWFRSLYLIEYFLIFIHSVVYWRETMGVKAEITLDPIGWINVTPLGDDCCLGRLLTT